MQVILNDRVESSASMAYSTVKGQERLPADHVFWCELHVFLQVPVLSASFVQQLICVQGAAHCCSAVLLFSIAYCLPWPAV